MSIRFPYSRQSITQADLDAVTRALTADYLTQGPEVAGFEQELGAFVDAPDVIACNNGTAALHLAYIAADLGPQRGLLTTPVTFLATASAARMLDAPVAFADVDPETGNISLASVERILSAPPFPIAAISVVHLGGRPADLPALHKLAQRHGCLLIEDACHALGARYLMDEQERRIGDCRDSDMAVFSFHAIKQLAMGEGGAITTRNPLMAEKMRNMRSHGMVRDPKSWEHPPEAHAPWYYEMPEIGYNYRVTDFQCALGRSQLKRLPENLTRRREIAAVYDELLSNQPHLKIPTIEGRHEHAWHLYAVGIDFAAIGKTRGQVMQSLAAEGVGTQVHYIPLYRQPYYRRQNVPFLPGAEAYYAATLSLPMYPDLSDENVAEISAILCKVARA